MRSPFCLSVCFEYFGLQGIQLLKAVQPVQRLHQLLFGEPGRQAQRVEQLVFPLGTARGAGKPPVVQVGVGDLPTLRRRSAA